MSNEIARAWNDAQYAESGLAAQRRYPNEEFIRFLAGYFLDIPLAERRNVHILEVGSGSGANLWVIAREGFDAYGLEISEAGAKLCREALAGWGVTATIEIGDMAAIPGPGDRFDAVADIYSSYCLDERGFDRFLASAHRVLKPGGKLFSFTPSKGSDAFTNHAPATLIDASTLNGIYRADSAYRGSRHPFRFISADEFCGAMKTNGFDVISCELTSRTYRSRAEYFEFVTMVAEKR